MGVDALAGKLMAARTARQKISLGAHERPGTWTAARQIADACCEGEPAAWKLGGTTRAVREIFQIDYPFYGPLSAAETFHAGETVTLPPLPGPVAEPEIAVRLAADVPPQETPRSDTQISALIGAIAPALDLAAVALADPPTEGALSLIADRAGAGVMTVGEWQSPQSLPRLSDTRVTLAFDGDTVAEGNVNALIGGVVGALRDFFIQAAREERTLKAGAIIATGGLAPAIPLGTARRVKATFEGWRDAEFELRHG